MTEALSAEEAGRYARQASLAYRAMLLRLRRRGGMYRYDEGPVLLRRDAHLWPFSRALMATLDLAGLPAGRLTKGPGDELDLDGLIGEHLRLLERFWDPAGPRPAYCSDVNGAERGGDRYYDDNAWVGLALIQLERLRPRSGWLARAGQLFEFARHGWDSRTGPDRGGVFWVEQGRGTGIRNHDRNAVSTATNAELGLHLIELGHRAAGASPGPQDMYAWVLRTLEAGEEAGRPGGGLLTHPGGRLFWDKVRGDGSVDRSLWTYNQGSMIGASVLLARVDPTERHHHLSRAEAIGWAALRHFAGKYERQPPAFNAIFFRNLLLLHRATGDERLREQIIRAMRGYADAAWLEARDRRQLFHLTGRPRLLDQSAMVQVLALLAWAPEAYGRLA